MRATRTASPDVVDSRSRSTAAARQPQDTALPVRAGLVDPALVDTPPFEAGLVDTAPVDTPPFATGLVDTALVDIAPVDTAPVDTTLVDPALSSAGTGQRRTACRA